jgi:predicted acyl esterase
MVAVRLCDVAPEGPSTRVSYGLLNLAHRASHERPEPLVPGERYRVRVELNHVAHAFPAGHRVRIAVSTCYWPIAWPSPHRATVTIWSGESAVELPVRPPDPADDALPPFPPPEVAPGSEHTPLLPRSFQRVMERDLTTNELVHTLASGTEIGGHSVARLDDIEMDLGYAITKRHRIQENDPLTARTELVQHVTLERPEDGWVIRVDCTVRVAAEAHRLAFDCEIEAREGGTVVRARRWRESVPRKLF